jgi:hypothetical protein
MVDASADNIGGALQQRRRPADPWQPLGFFSRKLDSTQAKYSAFDRELLACFQANRHFRFMVEGMRFTLYTDQKPLTTAVRRSTEPWTAKQCRQLAYMAEFTSDIQHIAGSDNVVADTLSRPSDGDAACSGSESPPRGTVRADRGDKDKIKLSTSSGGLRTPVEALPEVNAVRATPAAVDYAALAAHQGACPLTQRAASSTSLQIEKRVVGGVDLLCDISRGGFRPLVPLVDRPAVFAAFHGLAHAGTQATKRLIATRVMWRGLNSDVTAWVKNCQQCERAKASRQHTAAVQPIAILARRFTHIHVDIVGHWPQRQLVPVHSCGQVLTLVRGPPHVRHRRRQLRRCPHCRLDLQIRGTGAADLRQGYAVYLGHLGRHVPAAGYPTPANHCFPPSSKWYGREVPPPAEGRAAGPPGVAGLASTPPLGPDGAESRPHRGHRSLCHRGRLWRTAGAARADP